MFFNLKKLSVIVMSVVMLLSCAIPTYAQTNNAGTQTDTFFTGTVERPVSDGIWNYDAVTDTWTYTSSRQFKNTWAYITNPWNDNKPAWFYFDGTGRMLTGWQKIYWNGSYKYFYFHEAKDGQRGELLVSGVTPDGYTVDENGVWTVNGVAQQYFSQTSGSGSSRPRTIKEEALTIADVLPEDFPTTNDRNVVPEGAWESENGDYINYCYRENDTGLIRRNEGIDIWGQHYISITQLPLSLSVTKNDGNYISGKYTFVMSGNDLIQIEIHNGDEISDIYAPPGPPEPPYEGPTIASILPDDFPTTDYWSTVPEGAWVADNGNHCYKENDKGLDFFREGYDEYGNWVKQSSQLYLSRPVTKDDSGNYICDGTVFVMEDDKLIRIEYTPGFVTDGIFTPPQNKIETQQKEFVVPEEDKEYEPHIYTPDDNPEFTPSFKDKQSIEDEHVTDGGYNRKGFFAQQWKDLLLYILKQDKK